MGDAKTNKMIVSKNFSHPIDVKFPCVKFIMTPVWPRHDSINRVSPISHLYSDSWEENEFKEIAIIFKMTEDAVSFLKSEVKLKLEVYVIELDIEKELSHRSIFGDFLF